MKISNDVKLKTVLMIAASLFILGACFFAWQDRPKSNISPDDGEMSFLAQNKESVEILMVGDVMLDRGVKYMIEKDGKGDYRFPFMKIKKELESADILAGNLEGPVSDKGTKVGSIYSFRMDPKAFDGLGYAGFDVLLMANNHAFDYSRLALEDTLKRIKDMDMSYVGAGWDKNEAFSPLIKEVGGMKIGFLNYTDLGSPNWIAEEESSGIAWISESSMEEVKQGIKKAKKQADFLIVSLHAGNEYQEKPSSFQVSFARAAIDSGADLVVEHHPHVIQGSEEYKGKKIFYSLGNFIFDQGFSQETTVGQILKVSLVKSSEAVEIKEISTKEARMNEFFQPEAVD